MVLAVAGFRGRGMGIWVQRYALTVSVASLGMYGLQHCQ